MEHKVDVETLTPKNFERWYGEIAAGHRAASDFFRENDALFYCESLERGRDFERVWIFDADDTLWEDNLIYEEIIAAFTKHCLPYFPSHSAQSIRALIDQVEHELIPIHGFGAHGFHISMTTAFERLQQGLRSDVPRPTKILESIVPTLTALPREVSREVVTTLLTLAERGHGLILFTQGSLEVQSAKIARSGLSGCFDAIAITRNKEVSAYAAVLERFGAPTANVAVVGNSLKSEVLPAIELGLEAFHYRNPNSWHYVNRIDIDKTKYTEIDQIKDILRHV